MCEHIYRTESLQCPEHPLGVCSWIVLVDRQLREYLAKCLNNKPAKWRNRWDDELFTFCSKGRRIPWSHFHHSPKKTKTCKCLRSRVNIQIIIIHDNKNCLRLMSHNKVLHFSFWISSKSSERKSVFTWKLKNWWEGEMLREEQVQVMLMATDTGSVRVQIDTELPACKV